MSHITQTYSRGFKLCVCAHPGCPWQQNDSFIKSLWSNLSCSTFSCFLFVPVSSSRDVIMFLHIQYRFPVDVINTHTRTCTHRISPSRSHAMSKACLLPVFLRITRLFYLEIAAPLDMVAIERAPCFSVSICLSPSDSIRPPLHPPSGF